LSFDKFVESAQMKCLFCVNEELQTGLRSVSRNLRTCQL